MRGSHHPLVVGLLTALAVLGVAAAACAELASASSPTGEVASGKPIVVKRCGYTKAQYGRSAVYPWHMTCAQARRVITASDDPHAAYVDLPGTDGEAIAISGKFWVCTGNMGDYGCAYPWRPIAAHGQIGYAGPFTKRVVYETCSGPFRNGCLATTLVAQPPG